MNTGGMIDDPGTVKGEDMNRLRRVTQFAVVILIVACAQQPSNAQTVALSQIASGLNNPVALTNARDGSNRLFITEQRGRILILEDGAVRETPFLDIQSLVSCCGERGLLSVAFHPDYVANGFFFVNYTDLAGHTVVARFTRSSIDPNLAEAGSRKQIIRIEQPFGNHNGGQLQFGPDGFLYIGMGDGGSGGDPGNRAQNLTTLLGKILRIDIDGGDPYAVPADNPFVGNPQALPEIWSYGLRNPWRFSFDRATGDMFIGDVGQNTLEEVSFEPAGEGGRNYGWRIMEASRCFNPPTNCNDGTLVLPILEYGRSDGCSVSGGYRYRGSRFPSINGRYFYGDFCSGKIWMATLGVNGQWTSSVVLESNAQITSFGEDEKGEIHVVDHGGRIFRITSERTLRARPVRR